MKLLAAQAQAQAQQAPVPTTTSTTLIPISNPVPDDIYPPQVLETPSRELPIPPPTQTQQPVLRLRVSNQARASQPQQQQRFASRVTDPLQSNSDDLSPQAATDHQASVTSRAVQTQHQHIQLQNLFHLSSGNGSPMMNGMNGAGPAMQGAGAMNPGAAMAAVGPTPAGHQAELNVIYGLVEELSRQLAENRRQTEDIVSGIGRVRHRARERGMGNDMILEEAADEIYGQEDNIETLLSILSESLERAKNGRDANFSLVTAYARVLANLLGQVHSYKQRHIADVSAWHRSYRSQLAEARAENSKLREQVWEMQARAGRANKLLREFRKKYDEDENRTDRRVEDKARKQEIRFWKRMAMPEVGDDDDMVWSDDDDVVDPVEKERLREVERKVAEQAMAGLGSGDSQYSEDSEGEDVSGHMGGFGGVPMEREGSLPVPPPRPQSTGSTGGQTTD